MRKQVHRLERHLQTVLQSRASLTTAPQKCEVETAGKKRSVELPETIFPV